MRENGHDVMSHVLLLPKHNHEQINMLTENYITFQKNIFAVGNYSSSTVYMYVKVQ